MAEDPPQVPSDGRADPSNLREKARTGIVALLARAAILEVVTLIGAVFIARALGPSEFGMFGLVRFALQFFRIFGDVGLGAALVRQKEAPSDEQLSTIWWMQLALGLIVVAVVWVAAPPLLHRVWPDMPAVSVWLLRALAVELLLTMLRVTPSLLLERDLAFRQLSVIDVVNGVVFYLVAVPLALLGYGAKALVLGVLAQGVTGAVVAQLLRPWRPRLIFRWEAVAPLLRFGFAFQTTSLIGFFNLAVMPLAAGAALGSYLYGVVSWSQTTAYFPLSLLGVVGRVNFPLLSRLQDDRKGFADAVERSVGLGALVIHFFIALFVGIGPQLVQVVYGSKWAPAVPTLYVFSVALSVGYLVPVVGGAFDALGKPQIMMKLSIFWTIVNWVTVLGVLRYRQTAMAFALAYCVHILLGNIATIWALRREVPPVRVWRYLLKPALGTVVTAPLGYFLLAPWVRGWPSLVFAIVALLLAYFAFLGLVARELVREFFDTFRKKPVAAPDTA